MEIENEVSELKKEWDELKNRSFLVLLGFVSIAVGYGVWVGSIQTTVTRSTADIANYNSRLTALEVNNGEIKARLTAIEATLQEIKIAVKAIR